MIHNQFVENAFLRGPVPLSHILLRQFIQPGDCVVDATCGNGNDTMLLAELVGKNGFVWAFDIQTDAVSQTIAKLVAANRTENTRVINSGHETMLQHIDKSIKAAVFNLGYLPGGDRRLITMPETTVIALNLSAQLLIPGGVILVTVYSGHSGGDNEKLAVETWAAGLATKEFHVWRMGQINVTAEAPYLILIQKAAR